MKADSLHAAPIIRSAGLRATPGRIALFETLARQKKPLAVKEIQAKLSSALNEVTLYRDLEAFADAKLVARVDLQHGHAHYELTATKKHHHHLVCTVCGKVEDFVNDICESLLPHIAKRSDSFKTITSHSMELFGVCQSCA